MYLFVILEARLDDLYQEDQLLIRNEVVQPKSLSIPIIYNYSYE